VLEVLLRPENVKSNRLTFHTLYNILNVGIISVCIRGVLNVAFAFVIGKYFSSGQRRHFTRRVLRSPGLRVEHLLEPH
jgi:hypothetical protein